jgi:hypothetical protein
MKVDHPLWILACCGVLAIAVLTGASPARPTGDTFAKVTELLTSLIVITLLVERSLAVINDIWLGEQRQKAEIKVQRARTELEFMRKSLELEKGLRESLMVEAVRSGELNALGPESSALKLLNGEIRSREVSDRTSVAVLETATEEQAEIERRQTELRLRLGFVFALIVSAVGVRVLAPLFTLASSGTEQSYAFRATDIVLTAGLIAGGSAGINAIAELLGKYIEASRRKVA